MLGIEVTRRLIPGDVGDGLGAQIGCLIGPVQNLADKAVLAFGQLQQTSKQGIERGTRIGVGDKGGLRLTDDIHLAAVPAQFRLDLFPVADITHDGNKTRHIAFRGDVLQQDLDRDKGPVAMLVHGLECQGRLASLEERRNEGAKLLCGKIRLDIVRPHVQQLFTAVTDLIDGTLIDIEKAQLGIVEHEHAVAGFVEGHLKTPQVILDAFAFGDFVPQALV